MIKKNKFHCNVQRKLKLLAIFCSLSIALFAQTKSISGVVKSAEDGETLVGVNLS